MGATELRRAMPKIFWARFTKIHPEPEDTEFRLFQKHYETFLKVAGNTLPTIIGDNG